MFSCFVSDKCKTFSGFLQINHQYQVQFSVKDTLGEDLEVNPVQNVNVRIIEVRPTEDGMF